MYAKFWQLSRMPFENSCDPAFYFPSQTHHGALLKLRYLVEHDKGLGVLVGPTGSGKTFLTHNLLPDLPETYGPVARLMYPRLTANELIGYLAVQLGADRHHVDRSDAHRDQLLRMLEHQLSHHGREGRHPIFILDDAHLIEDVEVWHAVRLLLNYQQSGACPFTIILCGQPSLLGQLRRLPELLDRVAVRMALSPLTAEEIRSYILHRLTVAGLEQNVFTDAAFGELLDLTNGNPRRINQICDLALLVGYADNVKTLSDRDLTAAAEELRHVSTD